VNKSYINNPNLTPSKIREESEQEDKQENKLQEINAVEKFFEKYKNTFGNSKIKDTAFTKFLDKCE
jgi:hypothetical protein